MGEVWSARNVLTNRDFAIKLLLPALSANPEVLQRFVSEARATGQLHHPSLVSVYDAGRTPTGRPYLVMELLEGESLEHLLRRRGRLDALTTCLFLMQVARGLQVAHDAGIVHRDLSTANVFLVKAAEGGDPIPKVLDFGVSKFIGPKSERRVRTGDGAVLGSPEYMSPEQARGAENTDARTDVWSLGVLLYECLSGQVPFTGPNYNATMLAILNQEHRPLGDVRPDIDAQLAALVDRCLNKDRERRLQTAGELAERLERVAMRLAMVTGDPRGTPRRRATDRISRISGVPAPPTIAVSPAPAPRSPTSWRGLVREAPRSVIAVSSALGGTALGLVLGVAVAGGDPDSPASSSLEENRAGPAVPVVQVKAAAAITPPSEAHSAKPRRTAASTRNERTSPEPEEPRR